MKKLLSVMIIAIVAITSIEMAQAEKMSLQVAGDSIKVADGKDSVTMKLPASFSQNLEKLMNDTVINIANLNELAERAENLEVEKIFAQQKKDKILGFVLCMAIVAVAVVLMVFSLLLFRYLGKRRQCKMVECAIEANYKLPDGLLGNYSVVNNYMTTATAPTVIREANATKPQAVATKVVGADNGFVDWTSKNARQGIIWILVGVCVVAFFVSGGAEEMVALGMIPVGVGAYKLFIEYMTNKQRVAYSNYVEATKAKQMQAETPATTDANNPQ